MRIRGKHVVEMVSSQNRPKKAKFGGALTTRHFQLLLARVFPNGMVSKSRVHVGKPLRRAILQSIVLPAAAAVTVHIFLGHQN